MAKSEDGYHESWAQYTTEAEYGVETCDGCDEDMADGETYWTRDDEVLCESCFGEWREENS